MAYKDYSKDIANARKNKKEEKSSTTSSSSNKDYSAEIDRYRSAKVIGFDTLESDLASLSKTIGSVYNGWQTRETMENTLSSVQSMYDRIGKLQEYNKKYGGADLSETHNALKSVLDDWDGISKQYGKYKNADSYNEAVNLAKKQAEEYEGMKVADIGSVQKEVTDLEAILETAKKYNDKAIDYSKQSMNIRNPSAVDGFSKTLKKLTDERDAYLKSVGYESMEALEKAVGDKRVYLGKAQRLQDSISLSSVADMKSENYDKDFNKYAEKGKALGKEKNDWWNGGGTYKNQIAYMRENPEYLETYEDASDDNGKIIQSISLNQLNYLGAKYMTDDEAKVYNYYIGKEDEKGAENYLKSIEETLKQRQGTAIYDERESMLSKYTFGYTAGIDQFTQGIINEFNTKDSYIPTTGIQNASGLVREDIQYEHGTLGQVGYDLINTTSNMLPSILTSTVVSAVATPAVGGYVGAGLMGTSAAGNAYQEMLNLGYDKGQARTYSTLVGVAEAGLQSVMGGIGKLGGVSGKLSKLVSGIDNGLAKFAIRVGGSVLSEGLEEATQEVLAPIFKNLSAGYDTGAEIDWGEVVYSGLLGALSGGVLEGGGVALNTYSEASYNKNMGQTIKSNERVGDMFDIASTSPEVSSAYEAYSRYANKGITTENISDAKLGNLYSSVKADAKEVLESKKSTEEQKTEALKTLTRLSNVTTENTVAKEKKKLKVGEETKVTESDSAVDIQSLRVEGENVIATTEKGEFSVDDMTLSDADADIVANARVVSQRDGEEVANLFVSQYDGKTSIEEYSNAFELVSTLSKTESYTAEQILETKGILSTEQATEIYKVTRMAQEKANVQAREQAFEKMRAMMGKQGVIDDSVISYDNKATKGQVNWKDLGYRQRKAITFANGLFTAMGSNVVWTNKDKYSNGMYSIEGDAIFIDVYAGVNLHKLIGKDSIINTISHELTHQMEVHSPETFNEVKELVLDALETVAKVTDKSVTRADLIAKEIKRLDEKHPEQKHTEADAISELVAKACEDMLSKSKKGIELFNSLSKAEQKTLTDKIRDIISKLKNWITDLLKTYSSNSEEAKALRSMQDTFDEVLKRWDKMLADVAEQNKARKESGAVEKETSAEKRVLEQAREIDSDGNSYWQIETDKDIFKGIETVKGLQDAAYNYILNGDKGDKITDLIDGKELNFIRVSAKEYVYGEASKTLSTEEYKQKMRMSTSIIDLIENASIEYDAPDHKSHKMFPDGFKNYQGRVGIDETIFKYIVRVGKSKDGMIFYDINLEVDGKVPRANRTSLIKSSTSNNSISNPDKKVNTKSSKVLNEGKVLNADRDAEYLELAKDPVKNEARLREMVYEAAKEKGYTDDSSWRMGHTAPNSKDDISLDNLKESGLIPDDFWEHPEWYTHSYEERESYYKVKKAIELQETRNANGVDRPAHMWVYRAVDKTKNKREDYFRNGDWVTPSKEYAINEGKMNPNGYRIIKHSVSIKNLYWDGNSIAELGYDDGNNYAYADTLNNRKLLDPVTYYPSGEIIPLSKRFNRRDYDVKFSDRDTEYLNAVEKGDVETASKLIEEAAERVFSNSKVRGSDGKLRLVYHGTVNDFTVFKRQFANIEGDFGKGYYFTSNEYDVDANYANEEGPDLKIKIAKYAEQLEWDDEYADLSYEEREEIARQKFITSEPTTITAYLNMENPVYITPDENGTLLDYNESYDEEYDEYGEPEGLLIDFIEALQNNASDYAYRDVDFSFLYEYAYDNDGVYASDAVKIIKERIVDELTDENGELAVNEVIRLAFEEIGFDGIIDTSVYYKFRNMDGMDSGTTHYIVFDSEQIKSADIATYDDNGNVIPLSQRFDFSNEDIRYSDRDDVGYHAGDLGKAESLGSQGYGRDTGHFGRGTYFVGNKELVKDYNRRDGVSAPQHAVDFSNYNLYKIKNDKDGYDLHRQLQVIDGGLNAAWVKAAKDDKFFLYRGTEFYKIAEEKFGEENKYTDEALIYGLTELAKKANIEIPTKEQFSKESGYDLTDKYFDSAYQDHLKSVVSEQIEDIQNGYEKFRDAYWDLRMRFGFRGQVDEAMNKVLEYQKANRSDTLDAYKKDSLATVFMKALGYEGIDTRGTALDNTAYGSVIYDLREDSVLYSDREDTSIYDIMGETDRILKENEKLKADVERLNERLKIERKVTKGNFFNANQLGAVAGHLRNISNSTIDKVELMKSLKDVYSFIAESSEVITEELFEKCYRIADAMIENAKPEVIVDDYYKMILSVIRNTRISLSESQKKEAQNIFDKNWNRYFFGNVIITDKGIGLESKWQEWASQYPGVFDAEISDGDMVGELYNIITTLREASETVVEYNEEERKVWLANEIYNQYWNVSPIKTTADKYNERIKQLNFEHRKAMAELRNDYKARLEAQKLADDIHYGKKVSEVRNKRAEVEEQRKADREKFQKLYKAIRERKDKEIALAKQHGRERMEKYKENAERKTRIQSITANVLSLNDMLVKNSKDKHIPEAMKGPVASLIKAINFSSKRLLEKGEPTQKDISLQNALRQVSDMMISNNSATNGITELYGAGLDESIKDMMKSVDRMVETLNDRELVLQMMSAKDLVTLDQMIKVIKASVNKLNKFHVTQHNAGVEALGVATTEDVDSAKKIYKDHKKHFDKMKTKVYWNNLNPYYAFKNLGKHAMKIMEAFMNAQDKVAFLAKEVIDFAESVYTDKEYKKWEKTFFDFEIKQPSGKVAKFSMNVPQIMSLYCVSKQEDARRHLLYGVQSGDDIGKGRGITIVETNETEAVRTNIQLTEADLNKIIAKLDGVERTKEVADKLQEFMATRGAELGNEISMARWGIKSFGVENYFPIKVSDGAVPDKGDTPGVQGNPLIALLNMSFTHARNQFASQSIEIGNVFDVFSNHMSSMIQYNAMALPVLDMYKWMNCKVENEFGEEISVKTSIKNTFGDYAWGYFNTFLKDVNGSTKNDTRDNLGTKFFKSAKVAKVAANIRVALIQFTSYIRAGAVMDNKYLLKAFLHKPKVKKTMEHCGIALWKSMGYYDTDITKPLTDKIKHATNIKDKIIDFSLKGAELADKVTWGYLWNACELEVRDTRKDLKVGSEEFYKEIGLRLREVVYRTQVVDSQLTRSQMMRSQGGWDKMLTTFASESTLSFNLVTDLYVSYKLDTRRMGKEAAKTKHQKYIRKAITAYVMTNVVTTMLATAFDAFRDYDEEDKDEEYIAKLMIENFATNTSFINKIPYVNLLISIASGFSASRVETDWMESAVKGTKEIFKLLAGEGSREKAFKYLLKALSDATGIAGYNLYRDAMALYNLFD